MIAQQVLQRLRTYSNGRLTVEDEANLLAALERDAQKGWTAQELFDYYKNAEEVDPLDLSEEVALARMGRVFMAVRDRLEGIA